MLRIGRKGALTPRTRTLGTLGVVVGVLAVVALLWLSLRDADPSVQAAVAGAAATLLVATFTVVGGRIFERTKMIEAEQRSQWAELYGDFIQGWLKAMGLDQPAKSRTSPSDEELAQLLARFSAKAIPWASDNVIDAWSAWKKVTAAAESDDKAIKVILGFEDLLLAIRKDLGHKDARLTDHQLLRMFVTDFDSSLAPRIAALQR